MAKKLFVYNGTILFDPQCSGGDETKNYGYSQSVLSFMRNVGSAITDGGEWAFLLNTANDWEVTKNEKTNTIAAGLRDYNYFQPMSPPPKHWAEMNRKDVIDYLDKRKKMGKLSVYTSALCTEGGIHNGFDARTRIEEIEGQSEVFNRNDRTKLLGLENSSARATIKDLDELAKFVSRYINEPVFAVCDCNCFHNSAFVLGLSALNRAIDSEGMVIDPSVLIVNIDQHHDYSADEGTVKSDGWGQPLRRMIPSATYLSIGCTGGIGSDKATVIYGLIPGASESISQLDAFKNRDDIKITREDLLRCKSAGREDNELKDKFKALWNALASRACKLRRWNKNIVRQTARFRHYYITIDRDCMMYNYNQWGHQGAIFQDPKHVRDLVGLIGDTLREHGAKLAGFDVTGLPEGFLLKTANFDSKSRVYDDSNEPRVDTPCGAWQEYKIKKDKAEEQAKKQAEKRPKRLPKPYPGAYGRPTWYGTPKPKDPGEFRKKRPDEDQTLYDNAKSLHDSRVETFPKRLEEWQKKRDQYEKNLEEWNQNKRRGQKGNKEDYEKALKAFKEQGEPKGETPAPVPKPTCLGFCGKCQDKIVPNLKSEIEELYKLFNDLIEKQGR